MVNKNTVFDGLQRMIILFLIGEYSVSIYASKNVTLDIVLTVLASLISIIFSVKLLSYKTNCRLLLNYFVSILLFAVFYIILIIVMYFVFHASILPHRALNNGDGILLMLYQSIYLIITGTARLICLIVYIVKNKISNLKLNKSIVS